MPSTAPEHNGEEVKLAEPDSGISDVEPAAVAGDLAASADSRDPYERDLDDAIYYLQHSCVPCAERHFDRARRHGASDEQVEAARVRAQTV